MSYLRYLCSLAYCGVQNILCCILVLFFFVLCLVYPMLPVSLDAILDCPFPPSVYLKDIRKTTRIYSAWPKVSHQNGRGK